jgi:histidine triad (HIT) family protein
MDCLFCRIINGEVPAKKVFENDFVLAFDNIKPVHPVHALIIPKKHIDNVQSVAPADKEYLAQMLLAVSEVARIKQVDKTGYRLIVNYGKDSGMTIDHLHIHLLGGEELPYVTG